MGEDAYTGLSAEGLALRARAGDSAAMERLVESKKPMIEILARYYCKNGRRKDAIQDGWLGFLAAVRDYDPTQRPKFEAFVLAKVRDAIVEGIVNEAEARCQTLDEALAADEKIKVARPARL